MSSVFQKNRDILRRIKPQETKTVYILLLLFSKTSNKRPLATNQKSYENIILIGDFNVEISDSHMDSFCVIYHLKSLRKNIFACLFSFHNTISLTRHEQVCLSRLRFKR